jgi:predicted dehydrogenase
VTIRIGFLGTGFISRTHNWFLKHTSVDHRIVAVHDPDAVRAEAFALRTGATVVDEDEVLDRVDAVFVTAWTSEHERLVATAAERGVAVFCEKPLGPDAAAAQRMADAVENAGVASQVGLVLRFVPQFVFARSLLRDERAGRLLAVSFRDDQYIPVQGQYGSDWRIDPSRCGRGTLLEHSIHDVDVLQWLAGPVDRVAGVVREFHGHPRIDDVAVARLDFAGGGVGALTSIWHDLTDRPSQRHVEFFSERLQLTLDGTPDGPITWQFAGEPTASLHGRELAERCADGDHEIVDVGTGAMFNPLTPFLRALRDGTPAPLPLGTALPAHRLVDAVYASADAGGVGVDMGVDMGVDVRVGVDVDDG